MPIPFPWDRVTGLDPKYDEDADEVTLWLLVDEGAIDDPTVFAFDGRRLGFVAYLWAGGDRVQRVTVQPAFDASKLTGLPWRKWYDAAKKVRDARRTDEGWAATDAAVRAAYLLPPHPMPPGRKPHSVAFLRGVAEEFGELKREGDKAPLRTLAEQRGVPVTTAKGWLTRCRKLGLL